MSSIATARLAVAGAAVALLAACSPEQTTSIAGPSGPSYDIGIAVAGQVQVCIDPASPAGNYSIAIASPTNLQSGDVVASSPQVVTPGNCVTVLTKADALDQEISGVTVTASTGPAGTFSYTCVDDIAIGDALCTSGTTGAATATAGASGPHGSTTTFLFVADPVVTTGCTLTQGWWKNKGADDAAAFDFDGGTNNGLTILNMPVKGNPYIALAHQYIAASLNIAAGASIDGAAETAYNAATAYFAEASPGDPLDGGAYTKSQLAALTAALDLYNQGLAEGNPAHCDAEAVV